MQISKFEMEEKEKREKNEEVPEEYEEHEARAVFEVSVSLLCPTHLSLRPKIEEILLEEVNLMQYPLLQVEVHESRENIHILSLREKERELNPH